MDRRGIAPFRSVLLARLGPSRDWPLPSRIDQTWLLDPDDSVPVLLDRLARWTRDLASMPWIFALGEAGALLSQLAATRLDLRVAGATLIAPKDWCGRIETCALSLAPMPFPVLIVANRPGNLSPPTQRLASLALGWHASFLPDPLAEPAGFQDGVEAAMQARAMALHRALQSGNTLGRAKSRSDLPSSTPEIASRTSSIVART